MKKLLSILSICLVFVSCSPDRVLIDELSKKSGTIYFKGKPYNGVGFDVWENRQLKSEINYKDGKRDGIAQSWYQDGLLKGEINFKDGQLVEFAKVWGVDGKLLMELYVTSEVQKLNKRLNELSYLTKDECFLLLAPSTKINTDDIGGLIEQDYLKYRVGLITLKSFELLINSTTDKRTIFIPSHSAVDIALLALAGMGPL